MIDEIEIWQTPPDPSSARKSRSFLKYKSLVGNAKKSWRSRLKQAQKVSAISRKKAVINK